MLSDVDFDFDFTYRVELPSKAKGVQASYIGALLQENHCELEYLTQEDCTG